MYQYDNEPGQLTGRHRGTALSKAELISFIDDDVELNPQWVTSVIKIFTENEAVSLVGGPCLPKYHSYPPSWVKFFWQPTPYGGSMCLPLSLIDLGVSDLEIDPLYIFGLNYSIRKKVLLELGGFHPDCIAKHLQQYQGDGETGLSLKAKAGKFKALYSSGALLYHQVPSARLSASYFENWAYYNGVCQSFTDLRAGNQPGQTNKQVRPFISVALTKAASFIKKAVKTPKNNLPDEVLELQERFNFKYREGYNFHQSAFKLDESVKNWVLKANFWNYKLPPQSVEEVLV